METEGRFGDVAVGVPRTSEGTEVESKSVAREDGRRMPASAFFLYAVDLYGSPCALDAAAKHAKASGLMRDGDVVGLPQSATPKRERGT